MTPNLSRRIAAAVHALDDTLTLAQRLDIGPESEPADTFDELPQWIRDLVEQAEHQ